MSTPEDQPTATATPIYRFSLASWLSIYGRTCLMDFVKETDYATLERELSSAQAALAEAKAESEKLLRAWENRIDAEGELIQLRARVAELEADKARLDWLGNKAGITICRWHDGYQLSQCCTTSSEMTGEKYAELRAAIDAAKGTK